MRNRLKTIRKSLGMSQAEFGISVGVSDASISRLESGSNNFTDKMIIAICMVHHVNEQWFRTGEGKMFMENDDSIIEEVVREYRLDSFGRELLKVFVSLTLEQQESIKKIAYSMLAAVQRDGQTHQEFKKFLADTGMESAQEPPYGTEEWAEQEAALYKQELLAEAQEKTFGASQNIKSA